MITYIFYLGQFRFIYIKNIKKKILLKYRPSEDGGIIILTVSRNKL
ncbi:MAG: hypothetical protein GY830_05825 [Bacteroidetes bacterium]|nr:hypothetical protein [Bacteroidota bacterium]